MEREWGWGSAEDSAAATGGAMDVLTPHSPVLLSPTACPASQLIKIKSRDRTHSLILKLHGSLWVLLGSRVCGVWMSVHGCMIWCRTISSD